MRVGILGLGSIGRRHLQNAADLGVLELHGFDPDPGRLVEAAALGATVHRDRDAMLATLPDAVLVCTPPSSHAADAIASLDAGAHVFVEKPIGVDLPEVDTVIDVARAAERLVCVGYNLRFHEGLRTVKSLLDAGAIGRPLTLQAEFGQYLPDWRPGDYRTNYSARAALGGGIVLDASHEFDYVRWLAGEVAGVLAVTSRLSSLDIDVEDTAIAILRHASGTLAVVHVDCVQRSYTRRCKIVGTDGTLVWNLLEGVRLYTADAQAWRSYPVAPDLNVMYRDELAHFLRCVRGTERPAVDGTEGRRIVEIALAVKRSSEEHREVAI